MREKTIRLGKEKSKAGNLLTVTVEKDLELIAILKGKFVGIKWNPAKTRWELPYHNKLKSEFFTAFKGKAWIDYSQLTQEPKEIKQEKPTSKLAPLTEYHQEKINSFRVWLENQRYI